MTNNKQQTAVEWLVEKLQESGILLMTDEFEMIQQAKEMEKQQHRSTWVDGRLSDDYYEKQIFYYESFNDYFKLIYGDKDGE
jgi:hypothetical protein